jgi:sialic acid synthase SpsE
MACAHNGNIKEAKKLIDAAISANADAIQLQFFVADETVTPNHEAYEIIKSIEFNSETWSELINYARKKSSIAIFACTYDIPSIKLAINTNCDGIKLNSSDLSNPEVLIEVANSKIPFTLGTGASTLKEIKKGIYFLQKNGAENMILMHGVQNFPTKIDDLNINRLDILKNHFKNIPVGYADHTSGDDSFSKYIDIIAVGKGICVLEKHITLNRKEKGIDYQAALEPKEFKLYCSTIKKAHLSLGKKIETPFTESDLKYRKFQKKSIVAIKEIETGEIISREKLSFIRNETPGISPVEINSILGKRTKRKISKFENILTIDLTDE